MKKRSKAIEEAALQLGARIRMLRKKQDITQQELAGRSGVSLKYLQTIESSEPHNVSIGILHRLAKGFGMPLWKLLQFDD